MQIDSQLQEISLARYRGLLAAAPPVPAEDLHSLEIYHDLQDELAKDGEMQGAAVNWPRVHDLALRVLTDHARDLLAAAALTLALAHLRGASGLVEGLALLADLLREPPRQLPPVAKRSGNRRKILLWLDRRMAAVVASAATVDHDRTDWHRVLVELRGLAQMGDDPAVMDPVLFSATQQALANTSTAMITAVADTQQTPVAAAEAVAETAVIPAENQRLDPGESTGGDGPEERAGAVRRLQQALRHLAEDCLRDGLQQPRYYYLNRQALWLGVEALPQQSNGVCVLQPFAASSLQLPVADDDAGRRGIVTEYEQAFTYHPFWFAGQYQLAQTLRRWGVEYQEACAVIAAEVRALLARLPGLATLRFSDGSPLFDSVTLAWLQPAPAANAPLPATVAAAPVLPPARLDAIVSGSLQAIEQALQSAADGRSRYFWTLQLARHCAGHGRRDAAVCLLEALEDQGRQMGLAQWEPEMYRECIEILLSTLQTLAQQETGDQGYYRRRAAALYQRLCLMLPWSLLQRYQSCCTLAMADGEP